MAYKLPPKDPDAVLDYVFDWAALTNGTGSSDWLAAGETIDSYTVTVAADDDIVIDSDSATDGDTSVTVWLSGGTVGNVQRVTCHVVTSAGREDDRSILIPIQER